MHDIRVRWSKAKESRQKGGTFLFAGIALGGYYGQMTACIVVPHLSGTNEMKWGKGDRQARRPCFIVYWVDKLGDVHGRGQ